jgi:hypothetical protein
LIVVASGLSACALTVACGGAGAEAETPADEKGDEQATSDDSASEEMDEAPVEEAAPEPEEVKVEGPRDILVREGTLFMLDFDKSDLGIKVNEDCEKKSKDDPAKKANCVSKAMDKIPREGVSFDEDDEGNWWYIRFGVEKGVQVIYNKVQVEVGEPSGRNITLTPTGKDQAKRKKGTVPKELVFEVPDEYTVVLQDPTRGRMEFQPKLGLLEEGQPAN